MTENNTDALQNLSPEETQLAKTVVKCFFETSVLSSTAAFIAFKGTGNYINKSTSSTLKSWSTLVKFSTAFIAFSAARRMYGKVCIKRVESLPPSAYKEKILQNFKNPRDMDNDNVTSIKKTIQETKENFQQGFSGSNKLENSVLNPTINEETDNKTEDVGNDPQQDFDHAKTTHSSKTHNEFDYSKKFKPPVHESNSKPLSSRRNKYGDIIEDA